MKPLDIGFPKSESDIQKYRSQIREIILNLYSTNDLETALTKAGISRNNICIGFFAGAGTRWIKSLKEAQERGQYLDVDPAKPRCLASVEDLFTDSIKDDKTAIGAYNVAAFKNLGNHVVIYSSHDKEIQDNIFQALGIKGQLFKHKLLPGKEKVLGHGDAIRQAKELLTGSKYVMTYFSNDPNSRKSTLLSVLTFDYLQKNMKNPLDLLIPAAFMEKPKYPLILNSFSAPIDFAHNKLRRDQIEQVPGFSNVGLRIYRAPKLLEAIKFFEDIFQREGSYSSINNGTDELALDNIDKYIMDTGKTAILPICYGREIDSAKKVDDIPNFLNAMKKNLEEYPI